MKLLAHLPLPSPSTVEQDRDTRLVSSSAVRARGPALLHERALRATAARYLQLPGTLQHRAGLLDARDRRIGAGAARAVIQVELLARVVQSRAEHARALRRREESSAACVRAREKERKKKRTTFDR